MTKTNQNKQTESTLSASYLWSDDYSPAYQPSSQKMYGLHMVPEFKKG